MNTNGVPLSSGEGKRSAEATPDPEVSAKATRRRFTAAYKLSIIEQAGRCETPGEIGQLLRREGLYKPEVMRCLKRYVAREIYRVLTAPSPT